MKKLWSTVLFVLLVTGCAMPAADRVGTAKSEEVEGSAVVVEVTMDGEKIKKVSIDETGATSFDGVRTGTKKELGEAYNMKAFSDIGKEWNEQIKALEEYIVTNGVDAIQMEDQKSVNDDLKMMVTIKIDKYLETVKLAVENASQQK